MSKTSVRLALAGLLALAAALLGPGMARADSSATLSALTRTSDGTISGLLSVRAGQNTASVDPKSLVLSVGGKDFPTTTQPAATVERSTILLIDRSGSMRDSGMATVRQSVQQFLSSVPSDLKVGVVSFSDEARVDLQPTQDHAAVQNAVNGLKADGDTALYNAVDLTIKTLGATGDRSIILLSDGKDTITPSAGPQSEQRLKESGVRAEVIAFRTSTTDDLALGYLAAAGQGTVTQVGDSQAMAGAFTQAAKALDSQISWSAKPTVAVYGNQDIALRGTSNGAPFTAAADVDFGAAPAPTNPAPTSSPAVTPPPVAVPAADTTAPASDITTLWGLVPSGMVLGVPLPVIIGSLTLFVAIVLLVLALVSPVFKTRGRERVESIEQYVAQTGRRAVDSVRTTNVSGIAEQLVQIGDKVVEGRESTPKTVQLLQRADLPWRAGEWAVLRVISLIVGGLAGILLLHGDVLVAVLGALLGAGVGVLLPPIVLRLLATRRAKKFERQLPDVLTLVASSLSTGFSLPQALDAVAHDVGQPAAKEFSRAMAETRIGADLEESLERMADRMDSKNMHWATMAIQIQRKVGGNLAETLRTTATTLREREALFRQVRALSAEGRLSAWILIMLPIGIFLWMMLVNGDYISLLWKSLLGIAMCVVTLILMAIGVVWMRKVIEVKV